MAEAPLRTLPVHAPLDTLDLPAQSPSEASEKALLKRANRKDYSHLLGRVLYAEACRCGDNVTGDINPETGRPQPYERKDLHRYYARMMDCNQILRQKAFPDSLLDEPSGESSDSVSSLSLLSDDFVNRLLHGISPPNFGDWDQGLYTRYCKTRVCLVCGAVMTGRNINRYAPVLEEWGPDTYFVTLTNETVPEAELRQQIQDMTVAFRNCVQSIRRTHKLEFKALRKTEITRRIETGMYHPHFHCLVYGLPQAKALVQTWLARSPRHSSPQAQDIRKVTPGGLNEVLKYATKMISVDPADGKRFIDAEGLHVIVKALRGLKTLQPVGFRLPKLTEEEEEAIKLEHMTMAWKRIGEAVLWTYDPEVGDFIDEETGECLTGRTPTDAFEAVKRKTLSDVTDVTESDAKRLPLEAVI